MRGKTDLIALLKIKLDKVNCIRVKIRASDCTADNKISNFGPQKNKFRKVYCGKQQIVFQNIILMYTRLWEICDGQHNVSNVG